MLLVLIERTDAFLQGEQRLVNFGAIHLGLLVRVLSVRAALAASQVDERHFAVRFVVVL